jgi:hypothetical protein
MIEDSYIIQNLKNELNRDAINYGEKCVISEETSLYACLLRARDTGARDHEASPKSPN